MQSTDRSAFEEQLAVLFGGFPQFLTPPRTEAYWRGLQKMPLGVFVRCVDRALGEGGSEKLPTVNQLWEISRSLRSAAPTSNSEPVKQFNPIHCHAQRCLVAYLGSRGSASVHALQEIIRVKNKIVADFVMIAAEEEITGRELRDALFKAWNNCWESAPVTEAA